MRGPQFLPRTPRSAGTVGWFFSDALDRFRVTTPSGTFGHLSFVTTEDLVGGEEFRERGAAYSAFPIRNDNIAGGTEFLCVLDLLRSSPHEVPQLKTCYNSIPTENGQLQIWLSVNPISTSPLGMVEQVYTYRIVLQPMASASTLERGKQARSGWNSIPTKTVSQRT